MIRPQIQVRPLQVRDQQAVEDLVFHSYRLHTHLDWYDVLDWLGRDESPVRLAWQGPRLTGLMAISQPLNHSAWLRILALDDTAPAYQVTDSLWQDLLPELRASGIDSVSALVTRDWIQPLVRHLKFHYVEDVITLEREGTGLPDLAESPLNVRLTQPEDLDQITAIDQTAFEPPWQMARDDLWQARRVAAICTLAELEGQPVGYQISTQYGDSAHLARLAVAPSLQHHGVGSLLLHDVLQRFLRRRIHNMTVNTQAHNLTSQRLYRHFGFRRNGYDPGVWTIPLD